MAISPITIGTQLKTKTGNLYTITKRLQESIWLATSQSHKQPVIVKSVQHFRLKTERDVIRPFQDRCSHIRPLLDEVEDPPGPPALILKHLDDDLLHASNSKTLRMGSLCVGL
ncbi:hypothetical protein ASPTUDRAFT_49217 [Aspergillus tubingensis CBS 134.48]|uniref:Protein kinase domain-containing protein n=1 Tax=Aspergillus tubingensis (strain CBS 134.48) TaxID=767770 RepID=A0A1L9NJY7_ASPTC|nr:hypothetical protein ASPTUDRAFT_49217 [Aspergillus tubingensis CBS 134.48]